MSVTDVTNVHWTDKKCPQCGSKLLRDDDFDGVYYCSCMECDFGIEEEVYEGDLE